MSQKLIKMGFIVAGFANFSVIFFSRGFTNVAINDADPVVMSNFGLLMIVMWGLAYIASAAAAPNVKWLAGVFAVEKLIYVVAWIKWHIGNSMTDLFSTDLFAGIFYSIYGLNDIFFMIFFVWVFMNSNKTDNA